MGKVIVFDLGDVILKLNWEKTLSTLGVARGDSQDLFRNILTAYQGSYDRFERGLINAEEFFALFKKELSLEHDIRVIAKAWEHLIVGPVEGIEALLDRIPSHFELYVLSNISENLHSYLEIQSKTPLYPVLSRFKKIYASFSLKARKPEREIYNQVYEDLKKAHPNLMESEILFIDDRQDNAEGAIQAGWRAERSIPSDVRSVEEILKRHGVVCD